MKLNSITKSIVIIFAILFLFTPFSYADTNYKDQIKKEDGSLFEKIIAECIGGIAETVMNFTTSKEIGIGFKNYDELIFNSNAENDSLSPFNEELWNKTMHWYSIFAGISGSLILIAVIILSYKMMFAGMNTARKNEVKESLMRLIFGGVAISLAPLFIRILLFMNNSLIHVLVTAGNGSLDDLLGNGIMSSIKTGNAIATALVISMFIYLFVKLNIKFIIRQFTIIVFTIFTPVACGLWIINKNVTAASIWAGQILMNIFMQFIYCFLFLIYLAFLPSGAGWAVSLIWAMMILPLADALQNCLQNLTSRIAGVDNEQMANRAIGMGSMLGFGLGAIKEQFKAPNSNISNSDMPNSNGLSGIVSRAKSIINPKMQLSDSKDFNGNENPIRNVIPNNKDGNKNPLSNIDKSKFKSFASGTAKVGFNASKNFLKVGAAMAEGNFNNINKNIPKHMKELNKTEYTNMSNELKNATKEIGDSNEP